MIELYIADYNQRKSEKDNNEKDTMIRKAYIYQVVNLLGSAIRRRKPRVNYILDNCLIDVVQRLKEIIMQNQSPNITQEVKNELIHRIEISKAFMQFSLCEHFQSNNTVQNILYGLRGVSQAPRRGRNVENLLTQCLDYQVPFILVDEIEKLCGKDNDSVEAFCKRAKECFHLFYGYQLRQCTQRQALVEKVESIKQQCKQQQINSCTAVITSNWHPVILGYYKPSSHNYKRIRPIPWVGSHVSLFFYEKETDTVVTQNFSFHDILNNDDKQDMFAYCTTLEMTLQRVKVRFPHITEFVLVSDQSYEKSSHLSLLHFVIAGFLNNILLTSYFNLEEQYEKSELDLVFDEIDTGLEKVLVSKSQDTITPLQLHNAIIASNVKNTFSSLFDVDRERQIELQEFLQNVEELFHHNIKGYRFNVIDFKYSDDLEDPSSGNLELVDKLAMLNYQFVGYQYGKIFKSYGASVDLLNYTYKELFADKDLTLDNEVENEDLTLIREENERDEGNSLRATARNMKEQEKQENTDFLFLYSHNDFSSVEWTSPKIWNGKKLQRSIKNWKYNQRSTDTKTPKSLKTTKMVKGDESGDVGGEVSDIVSLCLKLVKDYELEQDNIKNTLAKNSGLDLVSQKSIRDFQPCPSFFTPGFARRNESIFFSFPLPGEFTDQIEQWTRAGTEISNTKMSLCKMQSTFKEMYPDRFDLLFDYQVELTVEKTRRAIKDDGITNAENINCSLHIEIQRALDRSVNAYLQECSDNQEEIANITTALVLERLFDCKQKKSERPDHQKHMTKAEIVRVSHAYQQFRSVIGYDKFATIEEENSAIIKMLSQFANWCTKKKKRLHSV
eukprot:Pgem_evm1s11903